MCVCVLVFIINSLNTICSKYKRERNVEEKHGYLVCVLFLFGENRGAFKMCVCVCDYIYIYIIILILFVLYVNGNPDASTHGLGHIRPDCLAGLSRPRRFCFVISMVALKRVFRLGALMLGGRWVGLRCVVLTMFCSNWWIC